MGDSGENDQAGNEPIEEQAPEDLESYVPLVGILEKNDRMVAASMNRARNEILDSIGIASLENAVRKVLRNRFEVKVREMIREKLPQLLDNAMKDLPIVVSHGIVNCIGEEEMKTLAAIVTGTFVCSSPCQCPPDCTGKKCDSGGCILEQKREEPACARRCNNTF